MKSNLQTQPRKAPKRSRRQARIPTMFSNVVRDVLGNIKHAGAIRHNLRTNAGIDWQAGIMGDYTSFGAASQNPTASTSTSLTDSGQAWTTNQWANHVCIFATNAGALGMGVILSNTATALTVDGWWRVGTIGSSAISAPATSANYAILPGGIPHLWMALSTDTGSPSASDTTLAGEITGSGLARALPTSYTHTAATNTYSISKTFTATGTQTINKEAVFNAQNGGAMPFESAEPSPPTLVSGDTLAQTITVTY